MQYEKNQFNCPVEATLFLIGGKYKPLILWHLIGHPLHYMELQRLIPKATPKMLSQQLHDLEDCGMIHREVIPEKPPKTIYSLTSFGCSIIPVWKPCANGGTIFWMDWMCKRHAAKVKNRKWVWLILSSAIPILLLNLRLSHIIAQCGKIHLWFFL